MFFVEKNTRFADVDMINSYTGDHDLDWTETSL